MPNIVRNAVLLVVPVAVAILVAIVTYMIVRGDDNDAPDLGDIQVEPGRVSCEMFRVARGYRYQTIIVQDLKERAEGVQPDQDPTQQEGFIFTSDITAAVRTGTDELPEAIDAILVYPEQPLTQRFIQTDEITVYHQVENGPWEVSELSRDFVGYYFPRDACDSLAPDLILSDLEGTPEEVNGIAATRYHFDELETGFFARHISFGGASDAGRFVTTMSGDIWVAEVGGYIVKMDMAGTGNYPNGRELEIDYSYELSDVNAKVAVEPPG